MTATTTDEETPLLHEQQHHKKKQTPLPWAQFTILLVLQLAEPLTSQVINPFAPQVSPSVSSTIVFLTLSVVHQRYWYYSRRWDPCRILCRTYGTYSGLNWCRAPCWWMVLNSNPFSLPRKPWQCFIGVVSLIISVEGRSSWLVCLVWVCQCTRLVCQRPTGVQLSGKRNIFSPE